MNHLSKKNFGISFSICLIILIVALLLGNPSKFKLQFKNSLFEDNIEVASDQYSGNHYPVIREYDKYDYENYNKYLYTMPESMIRDLDFVNLERISQNLDRAQTMMDSIYENRVYFSAKVGVMLKNQEPTKDDDTYRYYKYGDRFYAEIGGTGIIIGKDEKSNRYLIAYAEPGSKERPTSQDSPVFFLSGETVEKFETERLLINSRLAQMRSMLSEEFHMRGLSIENEKEVVQNIINQNR